MGIMIPRNQPADDMTTLKISARIGIINSVDKKSSNKGEAKIHCHLGFRFIMLKIYRETDAKS